MVHKYAVSTENLTKLESFFKKRSDGQGVPMTITVVEIAEGSGLALATAHRGIKELERRGIIKVIKAASRRETIQYIYVGSSPIVGQEALISQLQSENKRLRERLAEYEKGFDSIKIVDVDDSLQIIVKRK
ncbi:MAG: winged helix-turn-helix transcriptional regulator [Candidatus Pristimantibacillus sp.]